MSTEPKISIVTPNLNGGAYLEQAMRSVLNQDYPDFEYLVIDGGSTDNSLEIIRRYEDRLSYWCSEPDRGYWDAVNKGFQRATGRIRAWLPSDDFYLPGAFREVARLFKSRPEAVLVCGLPLSCDRSRKLGRWNHPRWIDAQQMWRYRRVLNQAACFWTSDAHAAVGELRGETFPACDYDFLLRIASKGPIALSGRHLACFRAREGQVSEAKKAYRSAMSLAVPPEPKAALRTVVAYRIGRLENLICRLSRLVCGVVTGFRGRRKAERALEVWLNSDVRSEHAEAERYLRRVW